MHTEICEDPQKLCDAAAQRFSELAAEAHADGRDFHVALAGGSTPKVLYRTLARIPWLEAVDWNRVHLFFGDERYVAPNHEMSNQRMARENLIEHLAIPTENVHPVPVEGGDPELDARYYAEVIKSLVPFSATGIPQFDLVLLGLGDDGHTASLFPGTPALDEQTRTVTPVTNPHDHSQRISITFPVINNARLVMFLVTGEGKKEIVARAHNGAGTGPALPIDKVCPSGELVWMIDNAAAALLNGEPGKAHTG